MSDRLRVVGCSYELKSEGGKVGYGWELADDEDGFCIIKKLVKRPDGKDGPAAVRSF